VHDRAFCFSGGDVFLNLGVSLRGSDDLFFHLVMLAYEDLKVKYIYPIVAIGFASCWLY
jgi:hypothetical protein